MAWRLGGSAWAPEGSEASEDWRRRPVSDIREGAHDDIAVRYGDVHLRFRALSPRPSVSRAHDARIVVRQARVHARRLAHRGLTDPHRDRPGRRSVASGRQPPSVHRGRLKPPGSSAGVTTFRTSTVPVHAGEFEPTLSRTGPISVQVEGHLSLRTTSGRRHEDAPAGTLVGCSTAIGLRREVVVAVDRHGHRVHPPCSSSPSRRDGRVPSKTTQLRTGETSPAFSLACS